MDRKLKRWEIALMCAVVLTLALGSWLGAEQQALAGRVVRLHVVANSDSPRDQALKLQVRDAVLQKVEELCPEGVTREETLEVLDAHMGEIRAAGEACVASWGEDQRVEARLEQVWFPTKEYDGFALPAGEYTAVRVVLGEGEGRNWWCVAFPPLCVGAAAQTVDEAAAAGLFTDDQASLMKRESEGYVLKFRSMELLGELQEWLKG